MNVRDFLFPAFLALAAGPAGASAAEMPVQPASLSAFPDLPLPPDVPAPFISAGWPAGRKLYLPMLTAEALARGLPPDVADAVARIESSYNPGAIGGDGERGMMQVMPPTAALLGFRGTAAELAEPATNIRLGVAYLADAWRLANGDLCRALMKYRAGHAQERMSALSVEYCRRAKSHLASIGSPLAAGALPAAEFGSLVRISVEAVGATGDPATAPGERLLPGKPGRLGRLARGGRRVVTGRAFWGAHMARIKAIEARLPWKRMGVLAGS